MVSNRKKFLFAPYYYQGKWLFIVGDRHTVMNILITGGAGFIGSHLSHSLSNNDNFITVIDNLSLGRKNNIDHLVNTDRLEFVEGDILDDKLLDSLFNTKNFDMIFHLAANSDIAKSLTCPNIDKDNTFMTTFALLNKMKKYGVEKIFFASTSAIYGDTEVIVDENYGPLLPVSHYGASKLASEAFISSFVECYRMQAWIVRFPNVVGENSTHGVLFDFIKKLKQDETTLEVLGNGEQCKPYLYVKDLIEAILFICSNSNKKLNIYNVGTDSHTKVKEIAQLVIEEMGLTASISYTGGDKGWIGDVPKFQYNLSKINRLGWKSQYSSTAAVRKAIQNILRVDLL